MEPSDGAVPTYASYVAGSNSSGLRRRNTTSIFGRPILIIHAIIRAYNRERNSSNKIDPKISKPSRSLCNIGVYHSYDLSIINVRTPLQR